ncbi:MAG: DUF2461 domain-containing protein [Calditrichaeota bacterium]|nr:DUF2461 domain-containing protein [Calditrichota bacterium]
MAYFTDDFFRFFKELETHNTQEWFHANKKRYEAEIKKPFTSFVQDLIDEVAKDDKLVNISPKDAMLRINRDIRFSKDKTPYNTYLAAIISPGGKKDKSIPGLYVRLDAKEVNFYGGCYMPEKDQLQRLRQFIADNLDTFAKLISDKGFTTQFGKIEGEQHKRIPAEFQAAYDKQPLIANKQFYYHKTLDKSLITSEKLVPELMSLYCAANPVMTFLRRALQ